MLYKSKVPNKMLFIANNKTQNFGGGGDKEATDGS